MMTIADMLARLEGLHSWGGYVARCPGHADLARQVELLRQAVFLMARQQCESAERDGDGR